MGNIPVKLFKIWASGSEDVVLKKVTVTDG